MSLPQVKFAPEAKILFMPGTPKTGQYLPTAEWAKPHTLGAVSPDDLTTISTTAGFKRISGKYTGCDGTSEVKLSRLIN
ncbi:MAG: hypothetical protein QM647_15825 [Asticcacaulis sp.]|uniref:hypothetical protein n=1 Tax=Asticcacaulis sp. TaxID=1872648 RepID=UPI0039E4A603